MPVAGHDRPPQHNASGWRIAYTKSLATRSSPNSSPATLLASVICRSAFRVTSRSSFRIYVEGADNIRMVMMPRKSNLVVIRANGGAE